MFLDFQIYVCFSILKSLKNKNEEKKIHVTNWLYYKTIIYW